ncbi:lmo0937 family membrane protein [Cellulophaga baltica]|nr:MULTISPECIES: lmo0937 family membrane protein [Cellulophaga]MBU2997716.1 lmo0937 family membrane protein [Cellulophaga baltica]MDO6769111.1 lmo0937 family membrane protein [Cellulophaga sp. 1_MG-2023]
MYNNKIKILAALLFVFWAIGFLIFDLGLIIHVALLFATITLIVGVIKEK